MANDQAKISDALDGFEASIHAIFEAEAKPLTLATNAGVSLG